MRESRAETRALSDGPLGVEYESLLGYEQARIGAAAIYCSDGRVGSHFDDFLHNGLRLPRYDRVALPGGPACLAGHAQTRVEERCVGLELNFLVEVHQLRRLVLIAHQGCAFYAQRLGLAPEQIEAAQHADLARAAEHVRSLTGIDDIQAYFARIAGARLRFEGVAV